MRLSFSRTHQNAYRVWSHRPSGGKSVLGTVAKLAGEDLWSFKRNDVVYTGATRLDAINAAYGEK